MSSTPVSPPTPPTQPGAPSGGGRIVAIVLAVVFGIMLLTVGGLVVVCYIFASKVSVTASRDQFGRGKTIRVETPFGRLRVEKQEDVDPRLLGIPIYPGATVMKGETGGARVDLDLDFADKYVRVLAVKMETSDPFDKVVEFYRDEAADFVFSRKQERAEFRWEHDELKKLVVVTDRNGKTRISLAKIGEPEAN